MATPDPTPSPTQGVPGGYQLRHLLGRGAFGEVWRAEAPGGVEVAVKVIHRSLKPKEANRELEALHLIKRLRHQNLLSLQAFFALEDRLVIVLELADASLRQRLEQCQQAGQAGMPAAELLPYFRETAEALDYLHANQVQHRDIKPDNILLLGRHAKLADYGLARLLEQHSLQTASTVGTPRYIAPEVWGGKVSLHSDQYSLAAAYAELRSGVFPFPWENLPQLMAAHLSGEPVLTGFGMQEQAVLRQALAKDPGQRFPSCGAFVQALGKAAAGSAGEWAPGPAPASPEVRPPDLSAEEVPMEGGGHPFERGWTLRVSSSLEPGPLNNGTESNPGKEPAGAGRRRPWLVGGIVGFAFLTMAALLVWAFVPPRKDGAEQFRAGGKDPVKKPEPRPGPPSVPQVKRAGQAVTNTLGMKFAWCPPGSFLMGSPLQEEGREVDETLRRVTIPQGFYLGVHEVTQAQWWAVMGNNPSHFKGDDLPVENVSWEDCQEFCRKLGQRDGKRYRLPTEEEWEYACRAGTITPFHFGETISSDQANYHGEHVYGKGQKGKDRGKTTPVGSFPPNAWGLYDMHGNVWEWCQDAYGPYGENDKKDIQGNNKAAARVARGGSWFNEPRSCRSASRGKTGPATRDYSIGCRVVLCLD